MAAEGNLFSKNTNLKNGELFFNPFKEAILDSSDHTVTLENGHKLAGKKKPSPPKNSTRANHQKKTTSGNFTGGNPILTQLPQSRQQKLSSFRIPLRNCLKTAVLLDHHHSDPL